MRFDSGGINASGAELSQQAEREFYRWHAEAPQGFKYERRSNGTEHDDRGLFAELLGACSQRIKARGLDVDYTFADEFTEA